MRGRLIKPLLVEIHRFDSAQTAASGGYDEVFRNVRQEDVRYKDPILLHAQVEQLNTETQKQTPSGNDPDTRYQFVLHMRELEAMTLVGEDGKPLLRVNDKVTAIYATSGVLEQTFAPPIFVTEVQAGGLGLGGRKNLVVLICSSRPKGSS
jgi:hypothetical protein